MAAGRQGSSRLDLFLLLTALLCALTGSSRTADVRVSPVEAARAIDVAQAVAPAMIRAAGVRPAGHVVPAIMVFNLAMPEQAWRRPVPERRRR